jgi:2-dehydro-3-deoxygalactonokinase
MIAIDWGTSSFRAYRLAPDGMVLDRRSAPLGILAVKDGRFSEALESQIRDWLDTGERRVVMSGMIGSRQGWQETPYAHCPAGLAEIATAMVRVDWDRGSAWIAPGLTCRDQSGIADVMRGEEVQVLGALDTLAEGAAWICLPGTHSKWACVEGRRIMHFSTYMTGEVFAVMKAHSILGRMMTEAPFDVAAFDAGLLRARDDGGLLHHLFGVRTRGLFGDLTSERSASYLSGVLIGHELRSVPVQSGVVYVLGAQDLSQLYVHALRTQGYEPRLLHPDAVVTGLSHLAARLEK